MNGIAEPLDWIQNRYGNFFIIRIECGAGAQCVDYRLLVFDKRGKFIKSGELGRLAVDEEHSNTDSTWVIPLKL